jgi:hypothetical protein
MLTGKIYGAPPQDYINQANEALPRLLADIRQELRNVEDRRKHPRVAASFPVTLYPIHSAGGIDKTIYARCRDISMGGICVAAEHSIPTKYAYGVFEANPDVAPYALLIRFLRTHTFGREQIHAGQFRLDL